MARPSTSSSRAGSTSVTVDTRAVKPIAVRAELDVDFAREKWRGVQSGMGILE